MNSDRSLLWKEYPSLAQPALVDGDAIYRKHTVIFIFLISVFRLILAFSLELGNDETYYWLYSQSIQLNYFDHPPMVAIWIRLFTANLALEGLEGFMRLGSIAGAALSSWFLFRTLGLLHSERAGWFSVVLYHSSFYAGYTAGLYILPDSPQMVFWTLAIWMLARISKKEAEWKSWIFFGLAAGLCIMSKIHGIFLWAGLAAYMVFFKRSWLSRPYPYISFLLTLVIVSPLFFWNLANDFATFHSHSKRIGTTLNLPGFLRQVFSQIFFNNPVNVLLILMALKARIRKNMDRSEALLIFNLVGISLPVCVLVFSLFMNVTMPHWSGPGYVTLIPLASIWLSNRSGLAFPMVLRWSLGLVVLAFLVWVGLVKFFPGTYGSHKESTLGRNDLTLDMYGWKEAGKQFARIYQDEVKTGLIPEGTPMVTTYWWGAHLDYYFCRPLDIPMLGLGSAGQVGQYIWTNEWRKKKIRGNYAYCVLPSEDHYRLPAEYFENVTKLGRITLYRSGKASQHFFVYRLQGWKRTLPIPLK